MRIIFLDNLRSFALLLGLVFHSAIIYAETIGYALKSPERSTILDDFCFFVHSFRMPLFFFLSGFFSEMIWVQKGSREYWKTRSLRLVVPFLSGVLLFAPIQYYITDQVNGKDTSLIEFYWRYWTGAEYGLSHLWFLYYLIFYCILLVFIPGKNSFLRFPNRKNSEYLFLFFCITLGIALLGHSFFPKGWKFLKLDMYLFLYYFGFFFSGILAYKNRAIFHETNLGRRYKILIFLIAFSLLGIFEYYEKTDPLWRVYFWGGTLKRFIHISISSATAWIFIYFFIELFKRFFNSENAFTIYLRDCSLPVYLIHHPVSLVVGYHLLYSDLDLPYKFLIHLLLVFLISFLVYDSFVRVSPIWRVLLGMRSK